MGNFAHMTLPWADLPFVIWLARAGTLSGAARLLRVDRTTISRRVEQLEASLNEPLFDRFGGRFSLTSYGRQVFAAAECAEQELAFLERQVQGRRRHSGKIRVSLSEHLLITLTDCFHEFTSKHPNIFLELTATDRIVDLNHFESDVALRISRSSRGDLFTIKIGKPIFALYRRKSSRKAELRYIARPSESRVPNYVLKHAPRAELGIAVDGLVSMRELIAHGFGVGILPRYFGDRDPRIECCSDPLPNANFALSIALRPEQRHSHRIKEFVAFMEDRLTRMAGFDAETSTATASRHD